jgi:RNA polymerase sigma-70 factor (ECF subfamily)
MMNRTHLVHKIQNRWKAALRQGFDVPMDLNEKALLYRTRTGDRQAAGILYERYYREIYSYIYYRVSDSSTAENLTADVFVQMIRRLSEYSGQRETFISWLYSIARNLVQDYHDQFGEGERIPVQPLAVPAGFGGNGRLQDQSAGDCFRKAIRHLPEHLKEVIILRFVEGRSVKDIAELIHKSERSVRSLQFQALQSLEIALQIEGCL